MIHAPELREHVGKILPAMITKAATKHPRSIDDIAAQSRLDPNLVRGALLHLGNEGLVRPLDQKNNVWEISHDFVARILNSLLSDWRATFMRRVRPWLLPASVAVWAIALAALVQWGRAHHDDRIREEILAKGYKISAIRQDYYFVDACEFDGDPKLFDYLKQLPSGKGLRLCIYSTEGYSGLVDDTDQASSRMLAGQFRTAKSMFEVMKSHSLDEEIGQVSIEKEETGIWGPVQTQMHIRIFSQRLAEARLARVAQLTQLEELQLKGSAVDNLDFLLPLVNLHKITLANTMVRELSRLKDFPHLQELEIMGRGELKADSLHTLRSQLPALDIKVDGARFGSSEEERARAEERARRGPTPDQVQQLLGPTRCQTREP